MENVEGGGGQPLTLDDIDLDKWSDADIMEHEPALCSRSGLQNQLNELIRFYGGDKLVGEII